MYFTWRVKEREALTMNLKLPFGVPGLIRGLYTKMW